MRRGVVLYRSFQVPEMALGTFSWGDTTTWNYESSQHDSGIAEAFHAAIDSGVTVFDTSDVYGQNSEAEATLGKLLSQTQSSIAVAAKFMPWAWRLPVTSALLDCASKTRDRLGKERIDVYQIASMAPTFARMKWIADACAEAVQKGVVEEIGCANFSIDETKEFADLLEERGVSLFSAQVEVSLLRTLPITSGLLSLCEGRGVRVLAYGPLGMGRLGDLLSPLVPGDSGQLARRGRYSSQNPPPGGRRFGNVPMEQVDPILSVMRDVGIEAGTHSVAQVALNYVRAKGAVPIVGVRTGEDTRECTGALQWQLSDEQVQRLDDVALEGRNSHSWQHG